MLGCACSAESISFLQTFISLFTTNEFLAVADPLLVLLDEKEAYPFGIYLETQSCGYLVAVLGGRLLYLQNLYRSSCNLVRTRRNN